MFFVWFYAALPVARKSGQGFNARSFADKPCAAHSHSRMRAVAVDFAAIAACPSGPSGPSGPSCKVFRDKTCPVFLPGVSCGRRSLGGYSPWGHRESDTTERLHFHFHMTYFTEHNILSRSIHVTANGNISFFYGHIISIFHFVCMCVYLKPVIC